MSSALTLAEYVRSLQRGENRDPAGGVCRSCSKTLDDVRILYHRTDGCRNCIPLTRVCAGCEERKPVVEFDVQRSVKLGWKIESYCMPCRRQRMRDYYAAKKTSGNPAIGRKRCETCRKKKPASDFYLDGRYTDGLLPSCRSCRNAGRRP